MQAIDFDGNDFLVVNPFINEVSCQFIGNRPFCGQTLAGPNKKSDVSIGPFLRFSFFPRHNGVLFWTQIFNSNSCNDLIKFFIICKLLLSIIINYK